MHDRPILSKRQEVVCKAEDGLRVNPRDKTNKRNANDEDNKEKLQQEGKPCSCDDCGSISSSKEDEPEASSKAKVFTKEDGWDRASDFRI
ncbi:hypothetical protein Tco_1475013 [Tanacetum coccineum]